MNKFLFTFGSWACLSLAASCGRDDEKDKAVVIPPPVVTDPIPSNGPELPIARIVDGYTYKELLNQYCTVTLQTTNEEVLVGNVESDAAQGEEKVWFSVYFPYLERGFVEKTTYYLKDVKSSTCDLTKVVDSQLVNLALAPISVYADPSLKGEPVCTFPAGSTLVSDSSYIPASSGALPFTVPSSSDCKGLTRGWLYEWPAIMTFYPRS